MVARRQGPPAARTLREAGQGANNEAARLTIRKLRTRRSYTLQPQVRILAVRFYEWSSSSIQENLKDFSVGVPMNTMEAPSVIVTTVSLPVTVVELLAARSAPGLDPYPNNRMRRCRY